MHIDAYLDAYASFWGALQTCLAQARPGSATTQDLAFNRFAWRAVCAHRQLQEAVFTPPPRAPERYLEVERSMLELSELCARGHAYELQEDDPFNPEPETGCLVTSAAVDEPEGWLLIGLSALTIECLGAVEVRGADLMRRYAHGFSLERRFSLAEAGRLASKTLDGGARLRKVIELFKPAGESLWGTPFIEEAGKALEGRIIHPRQLLRTVIAAVREVPELPRDPWPYLEPQLIRHGEFLKIGPIKRRALKWMIDRLAGK